MVGSTLYQFLTEASKALYTRLGKCKHFLKVSLVFGKGMVIYMQGESASKSKFASNLSKLRREKGLSQRQAAAELGVSQALLSHYENDSREPRLDFVVKICDYYSVTTDYMLGRTKERNDLATRLSARVNEVVDSIEDLRTAEAGLIVRLRGLLKKE